jgi:SAM-dependent methyltransferase
MLDQIPIDVEKHVGTGEVIPLREGSVDAVYSAQAWHWVDPIKGTDELARVLTPGGTVGLIWNVRDDRVDWVERMSEIIHDGPSADLIEHPPVLDDRFSTLELFDTTWSHDLSRDEIAELTASRSHFIIQDADGQHAILAALRELLDTHPDTCDLDRIPMPYRTFAYRAALRPVP